jgi:hypothetical protein
VQMSMLKPNRSASDSVIALALVLSSLAARRTGEGQEPSVEVGPRAIHRIHQQTGEHRRRDDA